MLKDLGPLLESVASLEAYRQRLLKLGQGDTDQETILAERSYDWESQVTRNMSSI